MQNNIAIVLYTLPAFSRGYSASGPSEGAALGQNSDMSFSFSKS